MTNPILPGDIENAMIARALSVQGSGAGKLGYTLKTLKTYGGELSEDLNRIVKNFPAWWFVFRGLKVNRVLSPSLIECIGNFGVIVGAENLRSEEAARQGDKSDPVRKPGSYKLAMDAMLLFSGQTLGLDIGALVPVSVDNLVNDKRDKQLTSIYGVSFETKFTVDAGVLATGLDDFETFHANWDIPPHGNVGPVIPDDEHADATDHVTLPQ